MTGWEIDRDRFNDWSKCRISPFNSQNKMIKAEETAELCGPYLAIYSYHQTSL